MKMPRSDTYFKIIEKPTINLILLELLQKAELSVSELARRLKINKSRVSLALNNKEVSLKHKIKIAHYFGKDTREIWE